MSKVINISSSYVQDQRHTKVTERYNVIQASSVGEVMQSHGLAIANLKTGRARLVENADHQSTITRYRSGIEIAPQVYLDIVHRSYHIGRGSDTFWVGLFRQICSNGLGVSKSFFIQKVRHTGDTYENLDTVIRAALNTQTALTEVVQKMQNVILTPEQKEQLAFEAAKLLTPDNALQLRHNLLRKHRDSDSANDLWTTYNLVQENAMQGRVAYNLPAQDKFGNESVRSMTVRAIKPNSVKDLEFNQNVFDLALKFAA